jgi:hypothetical protein
VITGVDLLNSLEVIFERFKFHGTVGTSHVGDFECFFDHEVFLLLSAASPPPRTVA